MKTTSILCVATVLIGLTGVAWGHYPEGVTFSAFQWPEGYEPVMDGDLSEWEIVPEEYIPLKRKLKSEDATERREAIEALGGIGTDWAVDALIGHIMDEPDEANRSLIIETVEEIGNEQDLKVARRINDLLYNEDLNIKWEAAIRLGEIGDPRAVEPLITALEYDRWDIRSDIREVAARALGEIGDSRAVEPLIEALGDEVYWVREGAARALGKIGDLRAVEPLIEALGDEYYDVRRPAAWALGEIGDSRAVEPLIEVIEDTDYFVRAEAARALGKIGDPRAVEVLIETLGDEKIYVHRSAAWALRKIGDFRAIDPILAQKIVDGLIAHIMDDPDEGNRELTIGTVEKIGKERDLIVARNINDLLYNKNPNIKSNAAIRLGEIGDSRAVEPLIEALGDEDSEVREGAAWALGRIGDLRAVVDLLMEALGDEDCGVRWKAARALGEIGDPRAVEPLIEALGEEDCGVREMAARALGEIGD